MSTPGQYPKTNIVKLNPTSSSSATTRDNNGADGVSRRFYFSSSSRESRASQSGKKLSGWISRFTPLTRTIFSAEIVFSVSLSLLSIWCNNISWETVLILCEAYRTIHSICSSLWSGVFFLFRLINHLVFIAIDMCIETKSNEQEWHLSATFHIWLLRKRQLRSLPVERIGILFIH